MRICLFTPTFFPKVGGAEKAADTIVRGLMARGHEVSVLAPYARGEAIEVPYPVHRYWRPWKQNWWPSVLSLALGRVHRSRAFDVCLAFYGYPTGYAAARVKDRLGFGLVVTPRGADLYPHYREEHKRGVDACRRAGYRGADRIVSISGWITERLQEVIGEPLPPIDLVHNGLDLDEHDRLRDDARARPPDLQVEQPFVLHLGRVMPVKRVEMAVAAVAEQADLFRSKGWTYAIAGSGRNEDLVRSEIKRLGVGDVVQMLGNRTGVEKAWLYDNAEFMVTTSKEEGLPNAVVETMASGLPILASDIGPHRELIDDRGVGVLFQKDDPSDLARKLGEMIETDRTDFGRRALACRGEFSLDRMIDGYERACEAVSPRCPA